MSTNRKAKSEAVKASLNKRRQRMAKINVKAQRRMAARLARQAARRAARA